MHGDLCKHLGIDLSTDHPERKLRRRPSTQSRFIQVAMLTLLMTFKQLHDGGSGFRCIVTVNVLWLFLTVPWVGLQ